jgi:hypothetical protein
MKDCISFDDEVLPVKNFIAVSDELERNSAWSLINYSYNPKHVNQDSNKLSWGFEYEHDRIAFYDAAIHIKLKIQKYIRNPIQLCKIHVNGQTTNQVAPFHKDFLQPWVWTFVLFTNLKWNTEWGGEFVCYNTNTNKYNYVPYIPNRGVLVPSNWDHYGSSPNALTDNLRTSIGFSYVLSDKLDDLIDSMRPSSKFKSKLLL